MSSRPRLLPKRFWHFMSEMPKTFGCKKQFVVIQGQKYVPWPLDHGELDFALHPADAGWAKSASEMTKISISCNKAILNRKDFPIRSTFSRTHWKISVQDDGR